MEDVIMAEKVTGYSATQIALHWAVVVLVTFQFLAHNAIEASWTSFVDGEPPPVGNTVLTYMHVTAGLLVLGLALCRLYLRISRGAPAPPHDEPQFLKLISEGVHGMIYLLLLALPSSGAVAWFMGVRPAAGIHGLLEKLLLFLIAAHIAGALFQHLVRRSDVMMRMFDPERSS
ncbi:cytochrome b [Metarhizobium album]|nr:cytochrome b/b6 domain-containing protein [Rhizobium album]